MARKKMGDDAGRVLKRHKGSDALEAASSDAAPRPKPKGANTAPAYMITTVRLTREHFGWLRAQAEERFRSGALAGKPDSSAVIRGLIDAAMRKR